MELSEMDGFKDLLDAPFGDRRQPHYIWLGILIENTWFGLNCPRVWGPTSDICHTRSSQPGGGAGQAGWGGNHLIGPVTGSGRVGSGVEGQGEQGRGGLGRNLYPEPGGWLARPGGIPGSLQLGWEGLGEFGTRP